MNVVFVVFPGVTQLDFTAPAQVLSRMPGATVHVAAASTAPIASGCGFGIVPSTSFADCPPADVLCVPGGFGVAEAVADQTLIAFVARQAAGAQYVTSVCTGALILGRAGLVQGRRATTHWAYTELLEALGATLVSDRVVVDELPAAAGNSETRASVGMDARARNSTVPTGEPSGPHGSPSSGGPRPRLLITGGGVTAGIDFALRVVAEAFDPEVAQSIQLGLEYNPQPPFPGGHPDRAPAKIVDAARTRYATSVDRIRAQLFDATIP